MNEDRQKALRLLGLARRAGQVASGREAVQRAVEQGDAVLLWIAADAGKSAVKRAAAVQEAGVDVVQGASKSELGHILSRPARSLVTVNNGDFAAELKKLLPPFKG